MLTEKYGIKLINSINKRIKQFIQEGETDKTKISNYITDLIVNGTKCIGYDTSQIKMIAESINIKYTNKRKFYTDEEKSIICKLNETIQCKMKSISNNEESKDRLMHNEDNNSTEFKTSIVEENEQKDEYFMKVKLSELNSIDSNPKSKSFIDAVNKINRNFQCEIKELLIHLENCISCESENQEDLAKQNQRKESKTSEIIKSKKKRDTKRNAKLIEIDEEKVAIINESLPSIFDSFYYNKMKQDSSDTSSSKSHSSDSCNLSDFSTSPKPMSRLSQNHDFSSF